MKRRIWLGLIICFLTFICTPTIFSFASGPKKYEISDAEKSGDVQVESNSFNSAATTIDTEINSYLFAILESAGTILLLYGTYKLGMAFTNHEAKEYGTATTILVVAACLANSQAMIELLNQEEEAPATESHIPPKPTEVPKEPVPKEVQAVLNTIYKRGVWKSFEVKDLVRGPLITPEMRDALTTKPNYVPKYGPSGHIVGFYDKGNIYEDITAIRDVKNNIAELLYIDSSGKSQSIPLNVHLTALG